MTKNIVCIKKEIIIKTIISISLIINQNIKIMKKLLVASLVVLFAISANAQFKLGIKGGLNVANMKVTGEDSKSLMGFHGGLIADLSLGPIAVQPGVLFSQKGAKSSVSDDKSTLNYIDIPINVMYKIGLPGVKVLLLAGPTISYALNGKNTIGGTSSDIEFGSGEGQLKKTDMGLNIGAGIQVLKLQGTINYTFGLTNLSNTEGETIKNNVFSVSVAFLF
jgi:hypothetical protein